VPRKKDILCMQCDKPESQCQCDKYCTYCKVDTGVRMAEDGIYYCADCREACDLRLASEV